MTNEILRVGTFFSGIGSPVYNYVELFHYTGITLQKKYIIV